MGQVFINGPVNQFDDFLPPFVTDVNTITVSNNTVTWIDRKNNLVVGWNGVSIDSSGNIYYTPLSGSIVERPHGQNFDVWDEIKEGYYKNASEKYIGALWKGQFSPSEEGILEKIFYNWDKNHQRLWIFFRSPTVNDDTLTGFKIGDHWIDTLADEEWVLLDDAAGAALWKSTVSGFSIEIDPTALKIANNLSDLSNVTSARNNLGLGASNSPTFAGLTVGALSGYVKAIAGVLSDASTVPASDISGFINANQISAGNVSNTEFDYLDGVTSNIQTQFNTIGGKYVRSTRFETIGGGTSGTVTLPTGATVVLDDFGGTVDAVVTQITSGRPINEHTRDASGNIVTTTFDASGNWVFSSTPAIYPVAIVYRVRQSIIDYNGTDASLVGDYDVESVSGTLSSTNNAIVLWNGIDGTRLKNSLATIDISGNISTPGTIAGSNISGTNTGDQTITLTSDVTGSGAGSFATTISANVVTNAKLSQVATQTIKGRLTAGLGNVEDLTASQVLSILGIGGARVIKSGTVLGGSFAGNPKTFAVVFGTAFSSVNYSILITSTVNRAWTYQTKSTTGFTINANANVAFAGEVSWFAISTGESIE